MSCVRSDDKVSNLSDRGKKIKSDLFVEKTSATSLIAIPQKSIDLQNVSHMSLNVISRVEKYGKIKLHSRTWFIINLDSFSKNISHILPNCKLVI
jgi:hypothetical protein